MEKPVKEPVIRLGDIIVLLLTSLFAIALFLINILSKDQSKQVEDIFSAIQFFLSIAIGWFLQRLISISEFRKYMHQFAFGAYRRINDINNSLIRLKNQLVQMRNIYPKDKVHELDIIKAIADEMADNIESSIYDWEFFIGEDLKAIKRRKEIVTEMNQIYETIAFTENRDINYDVRLGKLENEISQLNSRVPDFPETDVYPREGRFSPFVWDHLSTEMDTSSCVHLKISVGEKISTTELNRMFENREVYFSVEQNMFTVYMVLYNKNRELLGMVENPFTNSDVYGNDYFYTILEVLSNVKVHLDMGPGTAFEIFTFANAYFVDLNINDRNYKYLKIPLTKDMIAKG